MREIAIALVQLEPKLGELEQNLVRMSEMIERVCLEEPARKWSSSRH